MKPAVFLLATLVAAFGFGTSLIAQTTVTFSHTGTKNNSITEVLELADGDRFVVEITDTDTGAFDYRVTGITLNSARAIGSRASNTQRITQEHSARYGGYYVKVTLKPGVSRPDPAMKNKTWIIATQEIGYHTDVNVGVLGTPLVNPKYYLEGQDGTTIVRQDRDAEDAMTFGFASFATIYHDRLSWLGGSIGLGLSDNNVSLLVGPTYRLGRRASLTAGYHWAQVERLPTGVFVGEEFDGDLNDLPTHAQGEWFFAITIRGFTDQFKKKLAKDNVKK